MSQKTSKSYLPTIGIECHVQLKTKTKLFAGVGNDAREAPPNTLISHICLGMPGALPVLNREAIHLATKAAFALNTEPQKYSYFERKHYFYPDLPKGYQITQLSHPIVVGGHVNIVIANIKRKVRINRVQIEEDAGKNTHPAGKDYSLVDLNRAGTPLLEIVSEPDMHSAAEAKAYARELYLLMRYADVSDADLYYGNMRFDVNVSVSKTKELGLRSEIKNLNSFRSVEKAVEYEIKRQIELLEKGQKVIQETRGWDDAKQKTFSQRTKEDAHDYRYMPEPDIPPLVLDQNYIENVKLEMPILPQDIRDLLNPLGLDSSATEMLVEQIVPAKFLVKLLSTAEKDSCKRIANWLVGEVQALVSAEKLSWKKANLDPKPLILLSKMVEEKKISSTVAKIILIELVSKGGDPVKIARSKNLLQVSDEGEIAKIVQQVLADNSQAAEDVKNGEMKAIGFLVGQVMSRSRGAANPQLAQALIRKSLQLEQ